MLIFHLIYCWRKSKWWLFGAQTDEIKVFQSFPLFFCIVSLPLQSIFKIKIMYAIVDIAGKQFKVSKDQYIYAPKMEGEAGTAVSFDKVLLTDQDGSVHIYIGLY